MGLTSHATISAAPIALERHAADQLHFIRSTMERASVFTALPGWGGVAIGITAIAAGMIARGRPASEQFAVWIFEGIVALQLGTTALLWKAKRIRQSLLSRPAKRALFSFAVPLFAGAVLTSALYRLNDFPILAGVWLLLYGVAIVSAGAHSVRIVPVMGLCFVAFGAGALLIPSIGANLWMASGFGGLHLLFGLVIARRYGG